MRIGRTPHRSVRTNRTRLIGQVRARDRVTIRRATIADLPRMVDLMRDLAEFEKMVGPDADAARRLEADFGVRYQSFVAQEVGAVVGYAIYYETYSNFLAKPVLWLEDLYVAPSARRLGVASGFMTALQNEARSRGCGRIAWAVLDWNVDAIRFYEKVGATKKDWLWYQIEL